MGKARNVYWLLLCNKLPKFSSLNQQSTCLSFCGAGIQEWLSWVVITWQLAFPRQVIPEGARWRPQWLLWPSFVSPIQCGRKLQREHWKQESLGTALEAGSHWFKSLPYAKHTHPLQWSSKVSSHYSISLKYRILLSKSGPHEDEASWM